MVKSSFLVTYGLKLGGEYYTQETYKACLEMVSSAGRQALYIGMIIDFLKNTVFIRIFLSTVFIWFI